MRFMAKRTKKVLKFRRDLEEVIGAVKLPQERARRLNVMFFADMARTPYVGRHLCEFWGSLK